MDLYVCGSPVSPKKSAAPTSKSAPSGPNVSPPSASTPGTVATEEADGGNFFWKLTIPLR